MLANGTVGFFFKVGIVRLMELFFSTWFCKKSTIICIVLARRHVSPKYVRATARCVCVLLYIAPISTDKEENGFQ